MNITGIVAEYNPFHNGHKYMIEQARIKGATHIIAVMSGAAVQRGDIAVFDKHFRAKKAVENGADLVIELPFPYSCSNGETFADSAIYLLSALGKGVVNSLAFGCENDNAELLIRASEASEKLKDNELVKEFIANGKSYPLAICTAAEKIYGEKIGNILKSPNNILAVEYIKACKKYCDSINFMPVKRKNASHDGSEVVDNFASASEIRKRINSNSDLCNLCPYEIDTPIYFLENMEREILFRIHTMSKENLLQLSDCNEEIADKILTAISMCPKNLNEFMNSIKSKNITMARLRRIIMYAILGEKKTDMFLPPYIRILAFNQKGAEILSLSKNSLLPSDTSLKKLESSSENAKRIVKLENNAVNFQYACIKGKYNPQNEFRRSIKILK